MDANELRAAWDRAARRLADTPGGADAAVPDEGPAFMGAPTTADPHGLEGADAVVLGIPFASLDPDVAAGPAAIRRRAAAIAAVASSSGAPAAARRLEAAAAVRLVDYGDVVAEPDTSKRRSCVPTTSWPTSSPRAPCPSCSAATTVSAFPFCRCSPPSSPASWVSSPSTPVWISTSSRGIEPGHSGRGPSSWESSSPRTSSRSESGGVGAGPVSDGRR